MSRAVPASAGIRRQLSPLRLAAALVAVAALTLFTGQGPLHAATTPQITSPTPGSPLPGGSVTFQWSAGTNVQEYSLWVGSIKGGAQYYMKSTGLNRTAAVSGLPTNGSTVYVRLWWKVSGIWMSLDYTFAAAGGAVTPSPSPTPAPSSTPRPSATPSPTPKPSATPAPTPTPIPGAPVITSPAPSTVLAGTSVTFQWTAGTNVQEYSLWVGSIKGGAQYYMKSTGLNRSATVSGLPANGSTVYVRLWWKVSGAWKSQDYTYTAAGGSAPAPSPSASPAASPSPSPSATPSPSASPSPAPSTPSGMQRWSDTATWNGPVPGAGAAVTIPAGKQVLLDVSPPALKSIQVDGELIFEDKDLTLSADWIMVHGRFAVGTADRPFTKKAVITLTGTDKSADVMGMGTKLLGTMGGTIDLHGEPRGPSWTRLSKTAAAGSTQLTLDRAVDWRAGDRLVVTSTDFDPNQAEEVVISAVSGATVTLQQPLKYQHWGVKHSIGGVEVDQRAEVGLLSRNVIVQGSTDSATSRFGGHAMVHTSGTMRISGVEFTRMGQAGMMGRYPVHYHLLTDASASYVKNSSIHHTYQRYLTLHAVNRLTVQEVVGYDTFGHGFFFEDGVETKNVLERNLGVLTRRPADSERLIPSDAMPATFWVTNPDNILRNNVAAGSVTFGFWYGLPEHPTGLSKNAQNDANVWPRRTPLGEFSGNVAHSNGDTGLMVDGGDQTHSSFEPVDYDPRSNPAKADSSPVIARFTALNGYKNRIRGVWLRGFNQEVTGAVLSDNAIGVTLASMGGAVVKDSTIIGETPNLGTPAPGEARGQDGRSLPQPWEATFPIRGFEFYDGIIGVERTTFANFQPNAQRQASALSHMRKNKFPIQSRNFATDLTFVNAKYVYHENPVDGFDGDKSAVFTDTDGSVTGTAGMKVLANSPFLLTKGCTYKEDWNSYLCRESFDWLEIRARGDNAPAISNTVVRREEDGVTQSLAGTEHPTSVSTFVQTNVLARKAYSIKFPGATPSNLRFIIRENDARDWVRLAFPAPSAKPYVYADLTTTPLAASSSLAALDSATTDAYFIDSATNTMYVKMIVKSPWSEWATLEVCTTAGCQ